MEIDAPEGDAAGRPPAEQPARRPEREAQISIMNGSGARVSWHSYLPVCVAVCSLCVALFSLYSQRASPEIALSMPDRVRVFDGASIGGLYLQPRFIDSGSNDRVEVVTGMTATLTWAGGGEPVALRWDEQGAWVYDSNSHELTWTFVADPAPLIVSRSSPQLPMCLFLAPADWQWQAGDYVLHLTADRKIRSDPLEGEIAFSVTANQAAALTASPGTFFEILTSDPSS